MSIQTDCLKNIHDALDWALDETRTAWRRALRKVEEQPSRYALRGLQDARSAVVESAKPALTEWFEGASRNASLEQLEDLATMSLNSVWLNLVCMNRGLFAMNGDPLWVFRVYVLSQLPCDHPLYLSPCLDGFGRREKG